MDMWHRALDSSTSTICIWCNLLLSHTHTLLNRLILRLRVQKNTKCDKVKIAHSHSQLFDWMTAKKERRRKNERLHYEMQVICFAFFLYIFHSFNLYMLCMSVAGTVSAHIHTLSSMVFSEMIVDRLYGFNTITSLSLSLAKVFKSI